MNKQQLTKITATSLAVAAFALVAGTATLHSVNAEGSGNYPPIVQRIAERFGLNPDEVQDEFQTMHEEHKAEREAQHNAHLDQLVSEGVLTQEEREELEAMHESHMADRYDWKDMTAEERMAKRKEQRTEMEAWATENGIDLSELHPKGQGMGKMGGRHGGDMHGFGGYMQTN